MKKNMSNLHVKRKLDYTHSSILDTIKMIKRYAENSNNIVEQDISLTTFSNEIKDECIQLKIPLSEHLTENLDKIHWKTYKDPGIIGVQKNIILYWNKNEENNGYWKLDMGGIIQCKRFNEVIDNEDSYRNCSCPKIFIETCSDLLSIIKNHSNNES